LYSQLFLSEVEIYSSLDGDFIGPPVPWLAPVSKIQQNQAVKFGRQFENNVFTPWASTVDVNADLRLCVLSGSMLRRSVFKDRSFGLVGLGTVPENCQPTVNMKFDVLNGHRRSTLLLLESGRLYYHGAGPIDDINLNGIYYTTKQKQNPSPPTWPDMNVPVSQLTVKKVGPMCIVEGTATGIVNGKLLVVPENCRPKQRAFFHGHSKSTSAYVTVETNGEVFLKTRGPTPETTRYFERKAVSELGETLGEVQSQIVVINMNGILWLDGSI